jgi:tocopherol O-methyltransferase
MPADEIERYYDRNTDLFLRIGASSGAHALHRGLWGPGVRNGRQAADYVHGLIANEIRAALPSPPRKILDLGCGVGGTLFHLAEAFPNARLIGLTLSGRQIELARGLAREKGLAGRCEFVQGDFEQVELDTRADAIVAIESYTHATHPEHFLETCDRHLADDGRVFIADDFLARDIPASDREGLDLVDRFRTGWNLPALGTLGAFDALATHAGFERAATRDLSDLIRTGRPRDRLVGWAATAARRLGLGRQPFWANVIGGDALNRALRTGRIRYCLLSCSRST